MDQENAFGSLPHTNLVELFDSLPIPQVFDDILTDIYTDNSTDFMVKKEPFRVQLTSGVRQGDPLSTIVYSLASEPLLRAAIASNGGLPLLGAVVKATAYADDIAVISKNGTDQQTILSLMQETATKLGLRFNAKKCVNFSMAKGRTIQCSLKLGLETLRSQR